MKDLLTRRSLIKNSASLLAVSALADALPQASSSPQANARKRKSIRLGGPVFIDSEDPGALAREHRRLGYRAAYVPKVELQDKDRIKAIIKEFAAQDVIIAEVGAWVNMLDPDAEKRRKNLAYVEQRLALAEEVGARCCVDIAGSYDAKIWYAPNPRNFSQAFIDATVENCRRLIDAVKPARTKFSIEMMPYNFPSGPDEYVKLLKAVDRKAFAVHLDVCNAINSPQRMYNNGTVIRECFQKLGPWIASCHGKDLAWEDSYQVCFREVIPGRGHIDYKTYLAELSQLPTEAPLMLEHLHGAEEYDEARKYVATVAGSIGLSLGAEA
jgi:sugar phosphate isomerase/epimerase